MLQGWVFPCTLIYGSASCLLPPSLDDDLVMGSPQSVPVMAGAGADAA